MLIGAGGRLPPANVIDDDGLASYDPAHDGIDFYESLEGMRVTVQNPQVIQSTNSFGETYVVASDGVGATGVAARGGLTLSGGDYNPERIEIDSLNAGPTHFTEGDHITSVTGILNYSHDEYEVLTSTEPMLRQAGDLARETTASSPTGTISRSPPTMSRISIRRTTSTTSSLTTSSTISALPTSSRSRRCRTITASAPACSAPTRTSEIGRALNSADPTAHYVYADIDPTSENSTGGEPNGNIRNAFVYNSTG